MEGSRDLVPLTDDKACSRVIFKSWRLAFANWRCHISRASSENVPLGHKRTAKIPVSLRIDFLWWPRHASSGQWNHIAKRVVFIERPVLSVSLQLDSISRKRPLITLRLETISWYAVPLAGHFIEEFMMTSRRYSLHVIIFYIYGRTYTPGDFAGIF